MSQSEGPSSSSQGVQGVQGVQGLQGVQGVPVWQPDEDVTQCFQCNRAFSFWFRRHHCRKCGRVVCGTCSDQTTTYPPSTYVVSPPSQIFLETPHVPHRTCDPCYSELAQHSPRDYYNNLQSSRQQGGGSRQQIRAEAVQIGEDDLNHCPVCGRTLRRRNDTQKEEHIRQCVSRAEFSGSPEQHRRNTNRMLVYDIPKETESSSSSLSTECTICFEEYRAGDQVARLECLCVYHKQCITDWFNHKGAGNCPVHAVHL